MYWHGILGWVTGRLCCPSHHVSMAANVNAYQSRADIRSVQLCNAGYHRFVWIINSFIALMVYWCRSFCCSGLFRFIIEFVYCIPDSIFKGNSRNPGSCITHVVDLDASYILPHSNGAAITRFWRGQPLEIYLSINGASAHAVFI